jgi:hypothetical protein
MYSFPLWSAALQNNPGRFAVNAAADPEVNVKCRSNAAVESHFRSVKHGRLDGRLAVRPSQFVDAELQFVKGKLNEMTLPAVTRRRPAMEHLKDTTEKWCKRRKAGSYSNPAKAEKIFNKLQCRQPKQSKPESLPAALGRTNTEPLSCDIIGRVMDILRKLKSVPYHAKIDGLEHPGLGQFTPGVSMPRFSGATERFVQVLHLPDHWVCATNVFSKDANHVFWYDSLRNKVISDKAVIQLTSILRLSVDSDTITIHLRNCARQPANSQLCGYYALTAAIAICSGHDPTQWRYDAREIVSCIDEGLRTGSFNEIKPQATSNTRTNLKVITVPKLHCICQSTSRDTMVACSTCSNWFHKDCVQLRDDEVEHPSIFWQGPCHAPVTDVQTVEVEDDDFTLRLIKIVFTQTLQN